MGKKSPPQPIIPPAAPIVEKAVVRKDLDKETREALGKATEARTSTVKGKASPQASLLAERGFWDEKEKKAKSLLK